MIDLGIEHVADERIWFRCGCIAIIDEDGDEAGVPERLTWALYSGDRTGFPMKHEGDPCHFLRVRVLRPQDQHRLAELCIEMRWLEGGGCPVHSAQPCVH